VFYGVAFIGSHYEILKIDVVDGQVRYVARPGGAPEIVFPLTTVNEKGVVFSNPHHDDPKVIEYRRIGDRIRTRVGSEEGMSTLCSLRRQTDAETSGTSPAGDYRFTIGAEPSGAYARVWRREGSGDWVLVTEAIDPVD
jgi:hypothetical protein